MSLIQKGANAPYTYRLIELMGVSKKLLNIKADLGKCATFSGGLGVSL